MSRWLCAAWLLLVGFCMTVQHSASAADATTSDTVPNVTARELVSRGKEAERAGESAQLESAFLGSASFDNALSLLSCRYASFMHLRAREREPLRWGGEAAVLRAVNDAWPPLVDLDERLSADFPERYDEWAELDGDIAFWGNGSRFAYAAKAYYAAIASANELSSDPELFRKLDACVQGMLVNAQNVRPIAGQNPPADEYLLSSGKGPVTRADIELWSYADSVLVGQNAKQIVTATDPRAIHFRHLLEPKPERPVVPEAPTSPTLPLDLAGSTNQIVDALEGKDEARAADAVGLLQHALEFPSDPAHEIVLKRAGFWTGALMGSRRFAALADLSLTAAIASSDDREQMFLLASQRVNALVAEGNTDAAMQAAKSAYNIAGLADTVAAAGEVRRAMVCAKMSGGDISDFIDSQTKKVEDRALLSHSALADIVIDAAPYNRAIRQFSQGADLRSRLSVGNLLLASGRVREAGQKFVDASSLAINQADRSDLVEALSGAIKALDLCPQRASRIDTILKGQTRSNDFVQKLQDAWLSVTDSIDRGTSSQVGTN